MTVEYPKCSLCGNDYWPDGSHRKIDESYIICMFPKKGQQVVMRPIAEVAIEEIEAEQI